MAESINASVGKYENGTRQCYNVPDDQSKIIRLFNQISMAEGGRQESPLPNNPKWGICSPELYQAILTFQRKHHLSVDGHIDPNQAALRKLNELAARGSHSGGALSDPVKAIREDGDYVEQRVKGVGILGLGGPFRLDLIIDAQNASPIKSFFMMRNKFSIASDPFKGRTEIALTGTIFESEQEALTAVHNFGVIDQAIVYTHYRGPHGIIFPTIISDTTAPRLMRALRLALEEERQFALGASKLLLKAFFTLAGLRYAPTVKLSGGAEAASELATLRETAQRLLSQQPAGRAVVNLAGTGEVQGAINVNSLIDQQVLGVPNLVKTTAESIGEVFPPSSVDKIVSNNVVFGQVNWAATARGCFTVLKPGGTVSIAPFAGQVAEQIQVIVSALRDAGFKSVEVVHDVIVTAFK